MKLNSFDGMNEVDSKLNSNINERGDHRDKWKKCFNKCAQQHGSIDERTPSVRGKKMFIAKSKNKRHEKNDEKEKIIKVDKGKDWSGPKNTSRKTTTESPMVVTTQAISSTTIDDMQTTAMKATTTIETSTLEPPSTTSIHSTSSDPVSTTEAIEHVATSTILTSEPTTALDSTPTTSTQSTSTVQISTTEGTTTTTTKENATTETVTTIITSTATTNGALDVTPTSTDVKDRSTSVLPVEMLSSKSMAIISPDEHTTIISSLRIAPTNRPYLTTIPSTSSPSPVSAPRFTEIGPCRKCYCMLNGLFGNDAPFISPEEFNAIFAQDFRGTNRRSRANRRQNRANNRRLNRRNRVRRMRRRGSNQFSGFNRRNFPRRRFTKRQGLWPLSCRNKFISHNSNKFVD